MTDRDATTALLASLQARWGAAAPRRLGAPASTPSGGPSASVTPVAGALALDPIVAPEPGEAPWPTLPGATPAHDAGRTDGRVLSTGFADLDAILGPGGLPREAGVALVGDPSSGGTTLALRLAAEAQAAGGLVAWLDLARSLDPVEAAARGIDLAWLVVLAPDGLEEGLAMGGTLLQGRAIDLLVVDLPDALPDALPGPAPRPPALTGRPAGPRPPSLATRIERLGALARRNGSRLVVLAPPGLPTALRGAIDEATAIRLAAHRSGWIRLGRDVVGQATEVEVERSRIGPPGRRARLRILYAEGGDRDACLRRPELLDEGAPPGRLAPPGFIAPRPTVDRPASPAGGATPSADPSGVRHPWTNDDAPSPSPLAPSAPPTRPDRPGRPRLLPEPGRPRRTAVGAGERPRPRSGGGGARRPARDEPRERTSTRP